MGKEKEKEKKERKQRSKSFMVFRSDKSNSDDNNKKEGSLSPRISAKNSQIQPQNPPIAQNNNLGSQVIQKPIIEDLSVVFPKHSVEEKKQIEGNALEKLKNLRSQEKIYLQGWLWREEQTREKWSKRWVVLTNHRLIFLKAPPSTVAPHETLPELALKIISVLKHGTKDGENRKPDTFILVTDSGLEVVLAACISDEEYEQTKNNNNLSIFDEKQSRNEWWNLLKDLISKSKLQYVYLKEEGRNILKEAAKKNMDCIHTITNIAKQAENNKLNDEGFKKQAKNLALQYTNLLQLIDPLCELDGDLAKATERSFIALNDAAVAVSAICPNKKAKNLILNDMISIAKETAAILHRSTDAHINPRSKEEIFKGKARLNLLVHDAHSFLNEISDFITDIDESLSHVENQISSPPPPRLYSLHSDTSLSFIPPPSQANLLRPSPSPLTPSSGVFVGSSNSIIPPTKTRFLGNQRQKEVIQSSNDDEDQEKELPTLKMEEEKRFAKSKNLTPEEKLSRFKNDIDLLQNTANDLSNALNLVHSIPRTPTDVKLISKDISNLMVQLLDATHLIAQNNGLNDDNNDTNNDTNNDHHSIDLNANIDESEYRRHHLKSLLAAAKGFSAATANFVDLFKQIPLADPQRQSRSALLDHDDDYDKTFKLKFDQASNNSEFALNAFLDVCKNIQFDNEATALNFQSLPSPLSSSLQPSTPNPSIVVNNTTNNNNTSIDNVNNNNINKNEDDLNALLQLNLAQKNLSSSLAQLLSTLQSNDNQSSSSLTNTITNTNNNSNINMNNTNNNNNINNNNEIGSEFFQKLSKITEGITENAIELFKEAEKSQSELTKNDKDYYKKDPSASLTLISSIHDVHLAISQLNDLLIQSKAKGGNMDGEEGKLISESIIAALHMIKSSVARFHVNHNLKTSPSPTLEKLIKNIQVHSNLLIHSAKDHLNSILKLSHSNDILINNINITTKDFYETLKGLSRANQIRAEFEAQAKIAELEALLDLARQNLFLIRRSLYGNRS